eukprot:5068013-Pleurochrysis_carterae.AAC.1
MACPWPAPRPCLAAADSTRAALPRAARWCHAETVHTAHRRRCARAPLPSPARPPTLRVWPPLALYAMPQLPAQTPLQPPPTLLLPAATVAASLVAQG